MAEYSRFFGGPEEAIPNYVQPQFAEVLAKLFSNGVFKNIANELEVTEHDPVALAVDVDTGEGWIEGFWYQNTAVLPKSLAAADPDNPRIDRIVLRLDTVTNFKISCEVLEGTPAAEPAAPELTQTAAIYEISLAQVYIAAQATSVSNANITDEREFAIIPNSVDLSSIQSITGAKTFKKTVQTIVTATDGATVTFDLSLGNIQQVTLGGNRILALSNVSAGQCFILNLVQDGTGSRTVTWFDTIKWVDGDEPTLTITANKIDSLGLICISAGNYLGYIVGQNL